MNVLFVVSMTLWLFVFSRIPRVRLDQALRRYRSRSWPSTKTIIVGGSVAPVFFGYQTRHVLTVTYSYAVGGERWGGSYTEWCASDAEAQDVLKSLTEFPPPARYKPGDPSKSALDPYRDAALGLSAAAELSGT